MARMAATAATTGTVVDLDADLQGTLKGKDAQVLGRFKGDIAISGRLAIGDGATVEAKVAADVVEISGAFKGELRARAVILLEKARVDGAVDAKSLTVRDGALVNGSINVGSAAAAAPARGTATG
jgi:cytoskeletal protein CcmA (bactofilin family)